MTKKTIKAGMTRERRYKTFRSWKKALEKLNAHQIGDFKDVEDFSELWTLIGFLMAGIDNDLGDINDYLNKQP